MKKILLSSLFVSMIAGSALAAEYTLDPMNSNINFHIDHKVTSTNSGAFYGIEGKVSYDAKQHTGFVEVNIPVLSLIATSRDFNNHLQSDKVLKAKRYPNIKFTSTEWIFLNGKPIEIKGNLTIAGKTNPAVLTATKFECSESPKFKTEVCTGTFTSAIDRTNWGLDVGVDSNISRDIFIEIQVDAVKQ